MGAGHRIGLGVSVALGLLLWQRLKRSARYAELFSGSSIFVYVGRSRHADRRTRPNSAVVVGSGVVGLSVAVQLAVRGCKVTVVDRQSSCGGECTPNSWAWINANSKQPLEYQRLNMLGMRAWNFALPGHVSWTGALLISRAAPQVPNAQISRFYLRTA
jgi:hypothetical protein